MIPMPDYNHPQCTLVVKVELNTCQKKERPGLDYCIELSLFARLRGLTAFLGACKASRLLAHVHVMIGVVKQ